MSRVIGYAVSVLSISIAASVGSFAHDDGQFASSPLKQWFDQLASGKGLCCSFADGVSVQGIDWDTQDGHYRVRLHGQWIVVPDAAVVTEPNRFDPAVWYGPTRMPMAQHKSAAFYRAQAPSAEGKSGMA